MNSYELRNNRLDTVVKLAKSSFENHDIVAESDNWWAISKSNSSQYATTIFADPLGYLYVNGDIDPIIFGIYKDSHDPIDIVHWIGSHEIDKYIIQKAKIGTQCENAIYNYDRDIAIAEVKERFEYLKNNDYDLDFTDKEDFEYMLSGLKLGNIVPHEASRILFEQIENTDFLEGIEDVGKVVSSRLIYAHAAVNKLSGLLK